MDVAEGDNLFTGSIPQLYEQAKRVEERFGPGPIDAKIQAHIIEVRA